MSDGGADARQFATCLASNRGYLHAKKNIYCLPNSLQVWLCIQFFEITEGRRALFLLGCQSGWGNDSALNMAISRSCDGRQRVQTSAVESDWLLWELDSLKGNKSRPGGDHNGQTYAMPLKLK